MDNVYVGENDGGLWQWLFGRSISSVVLLNQESDGFVAIAAPSPSRVLPIDLSNFNGEILCQVIRVATFTFHFLPYCTVFSLEEVFCKIGAILTCKFVADLAFGNFDILLTKTYYLIGLIC
jgi:hypothetical protein